MRVRQLEAFVVVAERLHFGRAAEVLHVSQPALSRQIGELERELGVPLLHRTRRGVELTEAGAAYLQELRHAMAQLDRAAQAARSVGTGERGSLRLGHADSAAYELLPRALRRFRTTRPAIRITLVETGSAVITEGLRSMRFDAGLVREAVVDDQIDEVLLFSEPFVAALPEDHPAAAAPVVEPASLRGEEFVVVARREAPIVHARMLEVCRRAGFAPTITFESAPLTSLLPIVGAGLAVAFVPLGLARHQSVPGVTYRPLDDPGATLELRAVWRRGDDAPLVADFVATVREVAGEMATAGEIATAGEGGSA